MRGYLLLVAALFGSGGLAVALPEAVVEERGYLTNGRCNKREACLGALVGQGAQASKDCVSYRQVTVTPRASTSYCTTWTTITDNDKTITQTVTNYQTETATSFTTSVTEEDTTTTETTTVATATVTGQYPLADKRSVGYPPKMPSYAKDICRGPAQYTSACECIHATRQTTYAVRPTVTKTATKTRWDCQTVTAQQTVDSTTTITEAATVTSTSTSITTTTASVTATTTITPSYNGPAFILQDMYNSNKQISVNTGAGHINLMVGPSDATPFWLDSDNVLHSYINVNQPVGYCPNPGDTNVFTHPSSEEPCAAGAAIVPLSCHLQGNLTLGSSGSASCTINGGYLASCSGFLYHSGYAPPVSNTTNTTLHQREFSLFQSRVIESPVNRPNTTNGTNTTTPTNTTSPTNTTNPTNTTIPTNGTNTTTGGVCSDRYDLQLRYTIVDPDAPLRRDLSVDADYAPPQRRRKNRPEIEEAVTSRFIEREIASE